MERAPLRPVPPRPEGPVDADEARRHVAGRLPELDATAAAALALVEVAGHSRPDAAEHAQIPPEELADALARGRKALRRSIAPLPGSGWCERAERLISDRIDGQLDPPGPRRLEVHLGNCPRCVEHEFRLAQATEALLRAFMEGHPSPQPTAETEPATAALEAPAPELSVVPPVTEEPAPAPQAPAAQATVPSAPEVSRRVGQRLAAFAWYGLFALAVALTVAATVVIVIGILGGEL